MRGSKALLVMTSRLGEEKGKGKKEEATYGGGYGISHTGFLSRRDGSGAAFLTERLRADVGRGALSSYAGGGTVFESSTGQSRNQSSALPTKPSTAYSVMSIYYEVSSRNHQGPVLAVPDY